MNILLELEELDDLIVKFTEPPFRTALQSKLRPIIEATRVELEAGADIKIKLEQSKGECTNLMAQLNVKAAQKPAEFLIHMGVLWKRTLDGFEPNPYCPKCKFALAGNPPPRPYLWVCASCHFNISARGLTPPIK